MIDIWLNTWLDTYSIVCYPHYCLFTLFMSFSYSSIYIFFICSHVICTCTFQFILTHSLGVLTPEFAYSDLWLFIADQIYGEDHIHLEKLESLSSWLSVFLLFCSCYFLILSISHLVAIFFLLFIYYHCVKYLYIILQWYWFIVVDFITYLGYFRLSVYAWGIFLAYIRRRLSSRLFSRILGSGAGQDFLGIRARFDIKIEPSLYL